MATDQTGQNISQKCKHRNLSGQPGLAVVSAPHPGLPARLKLAGPARLLAGCDGVCSYTDGSFLISPTGRPLALSLWLKKPRTAI